MSRCRVDTTSLSKFLYIHFSKFNTEGFDGRAKLSDCRANALPCPPLATPMPIMNTCTKALLINNYNISLNHKHVRC